MVDQSKKCYICGVTYFTSVSPCPACKRDEENRKKAKEIQELYRRNDDRRKQEELREQKRIREDDKQFQSSQFEKAQKLEHFKIDQQRMMQEEQMNQVEVSSIKDKVYNLALTNSSDIPSISRLIKLLLHQHDSHVEFIYKSVIQLDSPFDNIIKEVLSIQLKEKIENTYSDDLSIQQKSCKYFMPNFAGYEFDIFTELLMSKTEFISAIKDETENIQKEGLEVYREKSNEIEELKQAISKFTNTIINDTSDYKSIENSLALNKLIFGKENLPFPRLNWYFIAGYVGYLYCFNLKFSLLPIFITIIAGYIISYCIIISRNKKARYNKELGDAIRKNEYDLEKLIRITKNLENELEDYEAEISKFFEKIDAYLEKPQSF